MYDLLETSGTADSVTWCHPRELDYWRYSLEVALHVVIQLAFLPIKLDIYTYAGEEISQAHALSSVVW